MGAIEINLKQMFARKLGIRTTAKKLFKDLENENEAILNFEDIDFISRTFAQEYVYQKHESKVHIIEKNMSKFIEELLDIVEEDYRETCLTTTRLNE